MNNAAKSKEKHPDYCITAADDALKFDTQDDRKKSVKMISQWMEKPGSKIAKEIQALNLAPLGLNLIIRTILMYSYELVIIYEVIILIWRIKSCRAKLF